MPLLEDGHLVEDAWIALGDDDALPAREPVLVSLARFQRDRALLTLRADPVGVRLPNTASPHDLAADLAQIGLIVLEFPKFTDGRAYSQARILRERLGYRGRLRASGNVLRDQLLFMARCGFDSFMLAKGDPVAAWQQALAELTLFYQPTRDGRPTVRSLRERAPV